MQDELPSYRSAFPGLTDNNHEKTSSEDDSYNCMGHVLGECVWYDPAQERKLKTYWPEGVPRERTLEAYKKAFEKLGFQSCNSKNFESGFNRIAIFAKNDQVTHVTRQLDDKYWTSKLGMGVDLSHDLLALSGYNFGDVVAFMKKQMGGKS